MNGYERALRSDGADSLLTERSWFDWENKDSFLTHCLLRRQRSEQ